MEHAVIKMVMLIIYAVITGLLIYGFLTDLCVRKNITEETHPVFADCLRGAIAAVSCADMIMMVVIIVR